MDAAKLAKLKENANLPDISRYLNDRFAMAVPLAGLGFWIAWFGLTRPDWNTGVVMAVILVALPLALQIVDDPRNGPMTSAVPWLRLGAPAAGFLALLSVLVGKGFLSALLGLPWLAFASAVSVVGALRLLSRPSSKDSAIGIDLGLMGLGIAGVWFFFERWGGDPGLSSSTAYLHLLAFGAPFVVGCSARRLASDHRLSMIASGGSIFAALLSTFDGRLEVVAAGVALGVSVVVSKQLIALGGAQRGLTSSLLWLAGNCLIAASALNVVRLLLISVDPRSFAASTFQSDAFVTNAFSVSYSTLDTPTMAAIAGLGLVFLLSSLLALSREVSSVDGQPRATMVHVVPRSESELLDLLQYSATLPPGELLEIADDELPTGFHRGQWSLPVPDFDNSCDALLGWAGHESASIRLRPSQPQIAVGETFVMEVPVGPLTVTVGCRISDIVDEADRYGFAFTTLSNHVWEGSESLIVSRTPDGQVAVTATICWRPTSIAAGAVVRLTEALQSRAVNACLAGIAEAESALVGDYLSTIVEDVGSRKMEVSRQSLVQKPVAPFPHAGVDDAEVPIDPSPFDADIFNADLFQVDKFEAESSEAETLDAEPFAADSFEAEPLVAETFGAEPLVSETFEVEAFEVETFGAEPLIAESSEVETFEAEPLIADSSVTGTFEAESLVVESSVTESFEAESLVVESSVTELFEAESLVVESSVTELFEAESLVADPPVTETFEGEPLVAESCETETSEVESLIVESFEVESLVAESFEVESLEAESLIAESSGTESLDASIADLLDPSELTARPVSEATENAPAKLSFDEVFNRPFDAPDSGETPEFDSFLPLEG